MFPRHYGEKSTSFWQGKLGRGQLIMENGQWIMAMGASGNEKENRIFYGQTL